MWQRHKVRMLAKFCCSYRVLAVQLPGPLRAHLAWGYLCRKTADILISEY